MTWIPTMEHCGGPPKQESRIHSQATAAPDRERLAANQSEDPPLECRTPTNKIPAAGFPGGSKRSPSRLFQPSVAGGCNVVMVLRSRWRRAG